jgi:magnesium chelatase family protein
MYIEVDISKGLFQFNIAGLPDKTIKESHFRILSALKNTHFNAPNRNNEKVTISLFPIDTKKRAVYADLAIVFAYLRASKQIYLPNLLSDAKICCIGDVTLGGNIQIDQTDISHLIYQGHKLGIQYFIIPRSSLLNLGEGIFKKEIYICTIESLSDLSHTLTFEKAGYGAQKLSSLTTIPSATSTQKTYAIDMLEGLYSQKRALQIAIAGDHPILFIGPPGAGKSALAQSAIELMDDLTIEEKLHLTSQNYISRTIYQDINIKDDGQISFDRPVEMPHYKITPYQLIGNNLRPIGIVQHAYHGLLILDELAEYNRQSIETLRHRLEIHTSEQSGMIIATSNLCPCGRTSLQNKRQSVYTCLCTKTQIKKYLSKISGPICDRFHIISHIDYIDHSTTLTAIASKTIPTAIGSQNKIIQSKSIEGKYLSHQIRISRCLQRKRNGNKYNAGLTIREIQIFGVEPDAEEIIKTLSSTFTISKRKTEHVYKLARTIADLESKQKIESRHVYEAMHYVKQELY